ncbi:MAG: hypothetical protein HKP38_07070 [Croceitalea sp.]|nr:hypothetical protein [Croceitalea sp.]MBT8238959.1 hypothetical protein [Croceitalea sp.]NNC35507.1 hypothetical protein [Croceitalea sp.]NNL08967.1 hypothetical protein [Croceitalea sp.]NNM18059.1 hypothetical protein [Croceitalea sp.]
MKYALLLLVLISISCKDKEKNMEEKTTSQMKGVIMIHDEIMPQMGKLSHLASQLKTRIDSTTANAEYEEAIKELQDANQEMMDWMREFGERFDGDEILKGKALTAQKQEWLNEEEAKIKALQNKFDASIEKAELLLKKDN